MVHCIAVKYRDEKYDNINNYSDIISFGGCTWQVGIYMCDHDDKYDHENNDNDYDDNDKLWR